MDGSITSHSLFLLHFLRSMNSRCPDLLTCESSQTWKSLPVVGRDLRRMLAGRSCGIDGHRHGHCRGRCFVDLNCVERLLEETEADALTYPNFPKPHHPRLHTKSVQERANREMKRRNRVVQVFPSTKSLIRLVGAICTEIDENWSSHCYIAPTSLAELNEEGRMPAAPKADDGIKAKAAEIIEMALESVIDPKGRAA